MKTILNIFAVAAMSALFMAGCENNGTNANHANTNSSLNSSAYNTSNSMNSNMNSAMSNSSNSNGSASAVEDFLKEASQGGMAEVELGKLAATKATSADIKKFGQMMVDDHSKANSELKALAAKKGITLPTETDSSHKATIEDMKNLTGADFDKEYVENMYEDHKHDVAAFEEESSSNPDPDVKAFATKTLPVLRKHLEAIEAIRAKMK